MRLLPRVLLHLCDVSAGEDPLQGDLVRGEFYRHRGLRSGRAGGEAPVGVRSRTETVERANAEAVFGAGRETADPELQGHWRTWGACRARHVGWAGEGKGRYGTVRSTHERLPNRPFSDRFRRYVAQRRQQQATTSRSLGGAKALRWSPDTAVHRQRPAGLDRSLGAPLGRKPCCPPGRSSPG